MRRKYAECAEGRQCNTDDSGEQRNETNAKEQHEARVTRPDHTFANGQKVTGTADASNTETEDPRENSIESGANG